MGRQLIAGNWKMNGLFGPGSALAKDLAARASAGTPPGAELLVCPPAPLLFPLAEILNGSGIALGGQDCHAAAKGAHTGDISAEMLANAGCTYVIVGHSERRADHGESDAEVKAKAEAASAAGLTPIVCVGETGDQRRAGETLKVIEAQVRGSVPADLGAAGLVIAYEPVWAIGSGLTAEPSDVEAVHGHIRSLLTVMFGPQAGAQIRILYGGSVKPANAAELMAVPDVDGALVGGASLSAEDFWAIADT